MTANQKTLLLDCAIVLTALLIFVVMVKFG